MENRQKYNQPIFEEIWIIWKFPGFEGETPRGYITQLGSINIGFIDPNFRGGEALKIYCIIDWKVKITPFGKD